MRKIFALLVAVSAAFTGCTSSGDGGGDDGGQLSGDCALKIINGESCPAGKGPVALIVSEDSSGRPTAMCSGAFIDRNKVITAAHCQLLFVSPTVKVYTGDTAVKAVSFKAHPSYNSSATYAFTYDVGVITLESSVDITPLPLLLSRSVKAGDSIYVYGFGLDEEGKTAVDRDWGNSARRTSMVVLGIEQGGIVSQFDTTHSGACEGDSGGPALAKSDGGSWGIAGVVSGGTTESCQDGTYEVFVELDRQQIIEFVQSQAPGMGAV